MDAKRQDIIRAATRLFSQKGYNSTSVDEIAKESGMAKASFYKYFQSKEDVLLETIVAFTENLDKGLNQVAMKNLPPNEKLSQYIMVYLDCIFTNNIHHLLFVENGFTQTSNEKLMVACLRFESSIGHQIKECMIEVHGDAIAPYVWDIIFIMRGIVVEYIRILGQRASSADSVELARFMVFITDTLICGIGKASQEYDPLWKDPLSGGVREMENAFRTRKLIFANMLSMEKKLSALTLPEKAKKEYLQVFERLKEELSASGDAQANGLVKAYLAYLEQLAVVRDECRELRQLLNMG